MTLIMKRLILIVGIALTATNVYAEGGPHIDKGTILLIGFIAVTIAVTLILCITYILYSAMNFYLAVLSDHTKRKEFLPTFVGGLGSALLIVILIPIAGTEYDSITYPLIAHWKAVFLLVVSIGAVFGFMVAPTRKE